MTGEPFRSSAEVTLSRGRGWILRRSPVLRACGWLGLRDRTLRAEGPARGDNESPLVDDSRDPERGVQVLRGRRRRGRRCECGGRRRGEPGEQRGPDKASRNGG